GRRRGSGRCPREDAPDDLRNVAAQLRPRRAVSGRRGRRPRVGPDGRDRRRRRHQGHRRRASHAGLQGPRRSADRQHPAAVLPADGQARGEWRSLGRRGGGAARYQRLSRDQGVADVPAPGDRANRDGRALDRRRRRGSEGRRQLRRQGPRHRHGRDRTDRRGDPGGATGEDDPRRPAPLGSTAKRYAFSFKAAIRFISPLFLLAAWFLWMIFLVAALSMRLMAMRKADSSSSVPTAATAFFTRVRTSDLTALLRSRATTVCLLRLIWLLIFATKFLVLVRGQCVRRAC